MKTEIISRNYQLNDHIKEVTEKKLSKLDKYFEDGGTLARVCFKKQGNSCTTEITLSYFGKFVRATATGENFYDNLDVVLPKIEGQIRKYRTRFDKDRKNSAYLTEGEYFGEKNYEDKKYKVVKEKKFSLKPMTLDEAKEEMELLGHSFFVFKDLKTDTVQVLYLRQDGELGLITTD